MWSLKSLKAKVAEQLQNLSVEFEELRTNNLSQEVETIKSLCQRCLTLLSDVITHIGDGSNYQSLSLPCSSSMRESPSACVVCARTKLLFDAMRSHISFEDSLRNSSARDWRLSWGLNAAELRTDPGNAFRVDYAAVLITATHKRGYSWGVGGFAIYPDSMMQTKRLEDDIASGRGRSRASPGDRPVITCIEPALDEPGLQAQRLDFFSTAGTGSMALITSWANDCARSHSKCNHVFGIDGASMSAKPWYPDRLIHISTTPDIQTVAANQPFKITARIVEKTDQGEFLRTSGGEVPQYVSLSHCWGPPPDPKGRLGGRAGDVLTADKLFGVERGFACGRTTSNVSTCYSHMCLASFSIYLD